MRVEAQFVVMPQAIPGLENLATTNTVEASGVDVDGFHVGHDVLFGLKRKKKNKKWCAIFLSL